VTDTQRRQHWRTPAWAGSTIFCRRDDDPLVVSSAARLPRIVRPLPPLVVLSASHSPSPTPSAPPPLVMSSVACPPHVNIATALSLHPPSPPPPHALFELSTAHSCHHQREDIASAIVTTISSSSTNEGAHPRKKSRDVFFGRCALSGARDVVGMQTR
jgi:hypothetical protein